MSWFEVLAFLKADDTQRVFERFIGMRNGCASPCVNSEAQLSLGGREHSFFR